MKHIESFDKQCPDEFNFKLLNVLLEKSRERNVRVSTVRGGLGSWHLPGGPVGPPAR